MTKEKKRKVWQVTLASISGLALFLLGAAYQAGAQCVTIDFNTELINRNTRTIQKVFSEIKVELSASREEARKRDEEIMRIILDRL